jgi:hypothetical protein
LLALVDAVHPSCRLRSTRSHTVQGPWLADRRPAMAHRDFDYDRDYGLVPDLVKQFVVYLYRHIRSDWQGQQHWAWHTAAGQLLSAAYCFWCPDLSVRNLLLALEALALA